MFASDKNRALAGQPLHTNFKLAETGEYLALVAPDGVTVVWQFAPAYPPQRANISAGPAGTIDLAEPVPVNSPVRWHVPENGVLGTSWIEPGFVDAGWAEGRTALGYDAGGSTAPALCIDFNDRAKDRTEPGFSSFVLDSVGGTGAIQFAAVTRVFGECTVTLSPVGGAGSGRPGPRRARQRGCIHAVHLAARLRLCDGSRRQRRVGRRGVRPDTRPELPSRTLVL